MEVKETYYRRDEMCSGSMSQQVFSKRRAPYKGLSRKI
jgi:hypothetical protein